MENTEVTILCSRCNNRFPIEQTIPFEDEDLCEDCLKKYTDICDQCGNRIYVSEAYADSNHFLCTECYDYSYTLCTQCGIILNNALLISKTS